MKSEIGDRQMTSANGSN